MALRPSRLRRGEIVAGASAVGLLVVLFVVPWFRFTPPVVPRRVYTYGGAVAYTDASGWTSLPILRWLILVVALAGLLVAFFQASRSAPALPVAWDVVVVALGALVTLLELIRLPTDGGSPLVGAYLGLVATAALTAGAFMALRKEGGWVPDRDRPIETIRVGPPTHGSVS